MGNSNLEIAKIIITAIITKLAEKFLDALIKYIQKKNS